MLTIGAARGTSITCTCHVIIAIAHRRSLVAVFSGISFVGVLMRRLVWLGCRRCRRNARKTRRFPPLKLE